MAIKSFCISLVVVATILVSPVRLAAQTNPFDPPPGPKRVDLSGSTGLMFSTDWSNLVLLGSVSPASGVLEQVLVRDLTRDPGAVYDGAATYWRGRYGFRAHGGFSRSCLSVGGTCTALNGASEAVKVNTWMYDVGGAIGLLDYRPARWAWPYVFAGLGGVTYDIKQIAGPPVTFIERPPTRGSDGAVIVRDTPGDLLISIDELGIETEVALNFGVGTDFRIPLGATSVGVRLELSDHMHHSPIDLRVRDLDMRGGQSVDAPLDFILVHNLRAAVGFVLQVGR